MNEKIKKPDPVKLAIFKAQKQFLAVNDQMNFNKEASFALQIIEKSQALQQCLQANPESVRNSIVNVATTGLSLNPVLNFAYLIPRKGKCCLDPGYQGLIKILTDAGSIRNIDANDVFVNDDFLLEKGSDPKIIHKPTLKEKGEYIGTYAIAFFSTGGSQFLFMNSSEIEAVKNVSEAKDSKYSPWNTDFLPEMRKKTVIKRLYKILPKTKIDEKVLAALELENENHPVDFKKQSKTEDLFSDAEVIDENQIAIQAIENCKDSKELRATYESYKSFEKDKDFANAVNKKIKEFGITEKEPEKTG